MPSTRRISTTSVTWSRRSVGATTDNALRQRPARPLCDRASRRITPITTRRSGRWPTSTRRRSEDVHAFFRSPLRPGHNSVLTVGDIAPEDASPGSKPTAGPLLRPGTVARMPPLQLPPLSGPVRGIRVVGAVPNDRLYLGFRLGRARSAVPRLGSGARTPSPGCRCRVWCGVSCVATSRRRASRGTMGFVDGSRSACSPSADVAEGVDPDAVREACSICAPSPPEDRARWSWRPPSPPPSGLAPATSPLRISAPTP